jgi:glycosyltransferase involved in cell wall biosynthesis
MPVFNEEAAVGAVAGEWMATLEGLGIDYQLRIYNDGSTDGTAAQLERLALGSPRVAVCNQANRGHGPTVLRGYREAAGVWVFQVDSDGEMPAGPFRQLWAERQGYDLLLGFRAGRASPLGRRIITAASRLAVRLLWGPGIRDVNTPYRLMRKARLEEMLGVIPPDAFAPNVIISGLAVRLKLRVYQCPVPHQGRRSGKVSIFGLKLWRSAWRAFRQTLRVARSQARATAR